MGEQRLQESACNFSLFDGPDLAVEFRDAQHALGYMAEHADDLLGADVALMVVDSEGICQVALIDARNTIRPGKPTWYDLNKAAGLTPEDTEGDGVGRYTDEDKGKILAALWSRAQASEAGDV